MKINEGREAAYITSRVVDNSAISNSVDYSAFFSVITPKSSPIIESDTYCKKTSDGKTYFLPYLVRDVDTLDRVFGDARINPNVFKDLYSVRHLVQQGISCYVSKVYSGTNFESILGTESFFTGHAASIRTANGRTNDIEPEIFFKAKSTIAGTADVRMSLKPIKPLSLNQVYLEIKLISILEDTENVVASTNVLLKMDTKNVDLIATINSYLNSDLTLELYDNKYNDEDVSTVNQAYDTIFGYENITNKILWLCCLYDKVDEDENLVATNMKLHEKIVEEEVVATGLNALEIWPKVYFSSIPIEGVTAGYTFYVKNEVMQSSALEVTPSDYARSLETYNDIKYSGQFISELASNTAHLVKNYRTIYVQKSMSQYLDLDSFLKSSTADGKLYLGTWEITVDRDADIDAKAFYAWKRLDSIEGSEEVRETIVRIETFYVLDDEVYVPYTTQEPHPETLYVPNPNDEGYITLTALLALENSDHKLYKMSFEAVTDASEELIDPELQYAWKDESSNYHLLTLLVKINGEYITLSVDNSYTISSELEELTSEDRRGLQYIIKSIAAKRKDVTCIFTTPLSPKDESGKVIHFDVDTACDWVASRGEFSNLFDYGDPQATSYSEQSFYCEMYWSWLKWRVSKLVNGMATGIDVITVPASIFVIINSLNSFRMRGSFYPVAGDQGGVLPDSCTIINNPSLKSQRDQLVSYRINPIFDTGIRGIQIYGNETLNAMYSDLSAAHIARTLVSIRSKVDNYSETIKFSLNNEKTWGSWINYVSTRILDPIKSNGGLRYYSVDMGWNTTNREDIAKRKVNGNINLQFTQSLEIINLTFEIQPSSAEIVE